MHELGLHSGSLEEFPAKYWLQFTTASAGHFRVRHERQHV